MKLKEIIFYIYGIFYALVMLGIAASFIWYLFTFSWMRFGVMLLFIALSTVFKLIYEKYFEPKN